MQKSFARTDLAVEANSRLDKQYKGVVSEELTISNCKASRVSVTDDEAARALGKPIGDYFTLEMEKYVMGQIRTCGCLGFIAVIVACSKVLGK